MSQYERNGWQKLTCNFCGNKKPHTVYISICIHLPQGDEYPFTQTELCRECFDEHGIEAAFEHNRMCAE